jgi:hypothetical protein
MHTMILAAYELPFLMAIACSRLGRSDSTVMSSSGTIAVLGCRMLRELKIAGISYLLVRQMTSNIAT